MNKRNGHHNESGFTLIELIVVIAVVSILTTVSFFSFQGSVVNSRDSARKTDMTNIKVALKSYKEKNGYVPDPSEMFSITNSGVSNIQAYQGKIDENVSLNTIKEIPKDPRGGVSYPYSVTQNKLEFQIGMTLENDGKNIAYVDGEYKTVTKNMFPSLLLAISGSGQQIEIHDLVGSGTENRKKFILDGGSYNLPYDFDKGLPVANGTQVGFSGITSEIGVDIPKNNTYLSCAEIYNGGKYMGSGTYEILTDYKKTVNNDCDCSSGTNTGSCKNTDNTLLGYWDMETLSGGTLQDLSGNGNDGTFSGTTSTGGKIGDARNFNGVNNNILITNINNKITVKSNFTVGAWIFPISYKHLPYPDDLGMIIHNGFFLYMDNVGGITFNSPEDSWAGAGSAGLYAPLYSWTYITGTYEESGTSSTFRLYFNGILKQTRIKSILTNKTFNLYIGTEGAIRYFPGSIDDVRIYDRTWTDKEVTDYYNAIK
ncbi:MAG: prepilin-type N-terminal cleavage/methylation domain-containing protein [Candidatus Gracilibacteria bacterium]|nr:prepilin-type N-terminal cleavage/methylation domain-containing protein [Candidatus Gracilibacteria bacterium]